MIDKLKLENFKCFPEMELKFGSLSILCGINSGGKSSVIQGLLLGIESVDTGKKKGNIDLMNSRYNMNLYSFEEILYDDADKERIGITLCADDTITSIEYSSEESDNNLKFNIISSGVLQKEKIQVWYLGSDRMIDQYQKRGNLEKLELGKNNEYIAYILERGRSNKLEADRKRNLNDKDNILFASQVNEWLDIIIPGNQVMAVTSGNDNLVSLKFGRDYKFHRTNIGYGVSFVLPIIVSGLLAKKGDILIIENPELHLHPKAQSELSLFLSVVANAGVQVLIETHSDHIVNGVRK